MMDPEPHATPDPPGGDPQLQRLIATGLRLATERSLDVILQTTLEAGAELVGASFGAFVFNNIGEDGKASPVCKVFGLDSAVSQVFATQRPAKILAETLSGNRLLRADDITRHPHFGADAPFAAQRVRSYLAVPVQSHAGELLGALLYGHAAPGCFPAQTEVLVATLAAQAAAALDNAHLAEDITARKSSEAALRQSEKLAATGRLAATIAHEINNPLEAVTNLIYLCRTDPTVPVHAQRLLQTADDELARVSQIAQQTLGFYRDTTRPVEIDLNALLHGVVDLFARKMRSSRITCVLELEEGMRIFGLQGEMRQVFSNLLVNAIDASSAGTTIRIRARSRRTARGPGVCVLIADQGAGIPPAIRGRLFSPFFTTKESVGTGLGLWVTRGIVEHQGGSITFRSRTSTPTGTVFRTCLLGGLPAAEK